MNGQTSWQPASFEPEPLPEANGQIPGAAAGGGAPPAGYGGLPPATYPVPPYPTAPYQPAASAPYPPVASAPYSPATPAPYPPVASAPYPPAASAPPQVYRPGIGTQEPAWTPAPAWSVPGAPRRSAPKRALSIAVILAVTLVLAAIRFGPDIWEDRFGDANSNYRGDAISAADAPTHGDRVVVAADGAIAFEARADWTDLTHELSSLAIPAGNPLQLAGAYVAGSPLVDSSPVIIVMYVDEGSPISAAELRDFHEFMATGYGAAQGQAGVVSEPVSTSSGLDGYASDVTVAQFAERTDGRMLTFARGSTEVIVVVAASDRGSAILATELLLQTLRIDA